MDHPFLKHMLEHIRKNADEPWTFSYDLRAFSPWYGVAGMSNNEISINLKEAGLGNDVGHDPEYSLFFIYFESEAQAQSWVREFVQYKEWLMDHISLRALAKRYKEINV